MQGERKGLFIHFIHEEYYLYACAHVFLRVNKTNKRKKISSLLPRPPWQEDFMVHHNVLKVLHRLPIRT